MRRQRKAKIVATLGPASTNYETIRELFLQGVDVFRVNLSHGTHEDHALRIQHIRKIEKELDRPIAILLDLQGPKLRIGRFGEGSAILKHGQNFRLDLSPEPGDERRVTFPHPHIIQSLHEGTDILLDDGRLHLKVLRSGSDYLDCVVTLGGRLSDRKGVNIPSVLLPVSSLTEKDRNDLRFGLDMGVDWVALSFVQRPDDVAEARRLIGGRAAVLVKFEKPKAIEQLDELVQLADAVMVARGDLGVEMPPEDVPSMQKRLISASRLAGKPVVVATQMLESMISSPTPTRAEASDVATAIYDGADAVMLSAETASGQYPVEAVKIMNRIIRRTEKDPLYQNILHAQHTQPEATSSDAITAAAAQVAATISASAIVTYTTSGSTTLRAARERPEAPILCLTAQLQTARRLAIVWGAHCVHTEDIHSFSEMVAKACRIAKQEEFANMGEKLVVTAGVPFGTPGSTNVLRIAWVE